MSRGEPVPATATVRAMAPLSVYADDPLGSTGPGQAISQVTPFLVDLPVGEANAVVRLSQIAHATETNPTAASLVDARDHRHPVWFCATNSARHGYPRGHQLSALFQAGVQPVDHQCSRGSVADVHRRDEAVGDLCRAAATAQPGAGDQCDVYNGMLYYGINADRDAMSDVDLLPGLLGQSLDELLEASR